MSVPKDAMTEEDNKWIQIFQFEIKSPRTLREEESFYHCSNRGNGGYGYGCGGGGGSDGVISRGPQYSKDR